jgi:ppGpp synthetase/RelA/SpoT-type nucleotidyltranferase
MAKTKESERIRIWARDQIQKYKAARLLYEEYADTLEEVLEAAKRIHCPLGIVEARPKGIANFAEKIQRKRDELKDPISQLTDLCGGRLITTTKEEVKRICDFIEQHFVIDWDNSVDVSQRLKPSEFGYLSVHYIVQFKRGVFPTPDIPVEIPDHLYPGDPHPMKAEIQVRTLLEHAWAVFNHDRSYKSSFDIPPKWQRELASIAAVLEGADQDFSRIHAGLKSYASSYGSYMDEAQMRHEIDLLEIALEADPDNPDLAYRIGKLAIVLGNWDKAIEILTKHAESKHQPILRDLGVAMCKKHEYGSPEHTEGLAHLEAACESSHDGDPDAFASLAGAWKRIDADKMCDYYCRAFQIDPTDPYALGNYVECEIIRQKDTSPVTHMKPLIEASIQRCRDQADVGTNLPWAFYSMGRFYLLLGMPYESLSSYAKAIQLSADWMIDTSIKSHDLLQDVGSELPGYDWIRMLLAAGRVARFPTRDGAAIRRVKNVASKGCRPTRGPVVIVAGGCDPSVEIQMQSYRRLLLEAFRDFRGTVISGGTTAGISGLVGEVQEAYPDTIRTIGYVPSRIPEGVIVDTRYSEIRRTKGKDFSALEVVQNWIDLIASGVRPSRVKLMGINGGIISAAEFRIALAFGASVAIVQESGREAAKLLPDYDWGDSPALISIPADPMIARAFVGSGIPKLRRDMREAIAMQIHENYRQTRSASLGSTDQSMAEWKKLRPNLKDSNRQQADHIFEKLRQIGCDVHEVTDRPVAEMTFTDREIEIMAEMEHARWIAERLLDGWTYGPTKDIPNKLSPYLVPWSELTESTKKLDRSTVREIPTYLSALNLEVRRRP